VSDEAKRDSSWVADYKASRKRACAALNVLASGFATSVHVEAALDAVADYVDKRTIARCARVEGEEPIR
jgi:hypothetical protein